MTALFWTLHNGSISILSVWFQCIFASGRQVEVSCLGQGDYVIIIQPAIWGQTSLNFQVWNILRIRPSYVLCSFSCVGEKQPILQCPNLSHLCPFHGKYLSSSPVGVGWVLHWEGNAAECRLGAAGGRWDHDGPALECPMSQCAMDQSSGRLFCLFLLCPGTTVDKHARVREHIS